MTLLRSILLSSLLIGLCAGAFITVVQHFGTAQLIAQAEVYEDGGSADESVNPGSSGDHAEPDHHHTGAWEPRAGFERTAYTFAANSLTAAGYALVLIGLINLRGVSVTWKSGLVWGITGFACVMLAPMIGLPPELPGTPVAPLGDRQLWWIATVLATAAGIALLALKRDPVTAVIAIALIVAPQIVGAPIAPANEHSLAPQTLEHQFVVSAVVTSFLFWALLGSMSGIAARRMKT